jgi:hypothetical protein
LHLVVVAINHLHGDRCGLSKIHGAFKRASWSGIVSRASHALVIGVIPSYSAVMAIQHLRVRCCNCECLTATEILKPSSSPSEIPHLMMLRPGCKE